MIDILGEKGYIDKIKLSDKNIPTINNQNLTSVIGKRQNILKNKNIEGKLENNPIDTRSSFVENIGNPVEFIGITNTLKIELGNLTSTQLNTLFFGSGTINQGGFFFVGTNVGNFEIYDTQGNKICYIIIENDSENNSSMFRINKGFYDGIGKKEYDQYYKFDIDNNNRYLYTDNYVHYENFDIPNSKEYKTEEYLPNHQKSKSWEKYVVIQNNELVDMYKIENDYIIDISEKTLYDNNTLQENIVKINKLIKIYDFQQEKNNYIRSIKFDTYEGTKQTLYSGNPEDYLNSKKIEEYQEGENWNDYFTMIKKNINTENTMRAYLDIVGEPNNEKYKEQLRNYAIEILGIDKIIKQIKEYWGLDINLYTGEENLDFSKILELFTDGDYYFRSIDVLDFEKELNNLMETIQRFPKVFHQNVGLRNIMIINKESSTSMAEQNRPYGFNMLVLNGKQIKIPKIGLITNISNKLGYNIPEESKIYTSDGGNTFCHEYGHIITFKFSINQQKRCDITGVDAGEYFKSYTKYYNLYKNANKNINIKPGFVSNYANVNYYEDIAETMSFLTTNSFYYRALIYKSQIESGTLDEKEQRVSDFINEWNDSKENPLKYNLSDFCSYSGNNILEKKIDICKNILFYFSEGLMDDEYWDDVLLGKKINSEYWDEKISSNIIAQSFYDPEINNLLENSDYFKSLNIYPNPSNGEHNITIFFPGISDANIEKIKLVSVDGKITKEISINNIETNSQGSKIDIGDLSSLESGTYIVFGINKNGNIRKYMNKLIIAK